VANPAVSGIARDVAVATHEVSNLESVPRLGQSKRPNREGVDASRSHGAVLRAVFACQSMAILLAARYIVFANVVAAYSCGCLRAGAVVT
jgi:hypothetical protein